MTTPNEPLTDSEIAAFRELAGKVPSGEWHMSFDEHCLLVLCDGVVVAEVPFAEERTESQTEIDRAEFIAAARNIADRLAAELQELREQKIVLEQIANGAFDLAEERKNQLAAANARIAEITRDRDRCSAMEVFKDSAAEQFEAERDALRQRLADYEAHYARETHTNELADYRTMESNWREREAEYKKRLAEAEAEIEKLNGKVRALTIENSYRRTIT